MTIIIEPNNDLDYQLFVQLAQRLKVKYQVEEDKKKQNEVLFYSLAGSLDTQENGNELLAIIEKGKNTKNPNFTF